MNLFSILVTIIFVILGGGSVGCETADYLAPIVHDKAPRNREIVII